MESTEQIDTKFSLMAALPDDRIDLAIGALLIAKAAYPDLNKSIYLERLDRMAAGLRSRITAELDAVDIVTRINHLLFDKEKLRGNRENYYDPDNSFLNRVLDRKIGIPITLSLIYIEVGRRLGLEVRGIGLPGHFITALYHKSGNIFMDPFNRGEILTDDDCKAIIRNHLGAMGASQPNWLAPVTKKELLVRMLRNLKLIYAKADNDVMLFRMIHWILTLEPEASVELHERAMIYEAIGDPVRAIKDWQMYLATTTDLENEKSIRARIDILQKQKPRIH